MGFAQRRYDWAARSSQPPLDVDNPGAGRVADGARWEHDFDDGSVRLQSGGPGCWSIGAGQDMDAGLLMPRSFGLLLAQQWARTGAVPVHAAAFVHAGRGVLVLGDRGAGKSVTAIAALAAGGRLVSDDWVLLAQNRAGAPAVERLRKFFMLRDGWASERLTTRLADLSFVAADRPKSTLRVPEAADPRFPDGCGIDELWLLERARGGRRPKSSARPVAPAAAMARLIKSSMGMLFSGRFPHERAALMATLQHLLDRVACRAVIAGTDMVDDPACTLRALAAADPAPAGEQ